MLRSKPIIGISMGDPSGIGPEVLAAALSRASIRRALIPVVFGDGPTLLKYPVFRRFRMAAVDQLSGASAPTLCAVTQLPPRNRQPGRPTPAGAVAQLRYLQAAVAVARRGALDAICTGPVSKEQISRTGFQFTGHTGFLAKEFGCHVLMLMDGPRLRVALATNHLPLAEVSKSLRIHKLVSQLRLLSQCLKPIVKRRPRIAVCGLNPHAGEGGLLGREELTIIGPALERARKEGVHCQGPFGADGLFAHARETAFDAVLAMFHDQGLVATKTLDFERTVNVTLGLPLPRTSPDHGVAYALAGKGRASAEPMAQALLKAAHYARANRARRE